MVNFLDSPYCIEEAHSWYCLFSTSVPSAQKQKRDFFGPVHHNGVIKANITHRDKIFSMFFLVLVLPKICQHFCPYLKNWTSTLKYPTSLHTGIAEKQDIVTFSNTNRNCKTVQIGQSCQQKPLNFQLLVYSTEIQCVYVGGRPRITKESLPFLENILV